MKNLKVVELTKMEMEIVDAIEMSDHSTDGHGLGGYIYKDEFPMKKYRGVISSLIKKGVIESENYEVNGEDYTWCCITSKHQEENDDNEDTGYDLINIALKINN